MLTFLASVKHLNFSRAAHELGLTPSAVSRQVSNLEAHLGVRLFVRDGRQLALTQAGQTYHARIKEPLREICHASLEILASRDQADLLTIASVPTFTTKWLVPRLPRFLALEPSVTLSFRRHLAHGDPFPPELDAAVRYGDGRWEGVLSDYLDGHTFALVGSPEFAQRHPIREPADVVGAPRLVHEQAASAWIKWAEQYGVTKMRALAGSRFEQYSVLIQAACAGLGLALVPEFLIRDLLSSGALIEPIDAPIEVDDQGHYLCCPAERLAAKPGLQRFRAWMIAECRGPSEPAIALHGPRLVDRGAASTRQLR